MEVRLLLRPHGRHLLVPAAPSEVYRLLGLRVEVFVDQTIGSKACARWTRGSKSAHADPPRDVQEGIDRIERELAALRRRHCEENATAG